MAEQHGSKQLHQRELHDGWRMIASYRLYAAHMFTDVASALLMPVSEANVCSCQQRLM
jgi:hypothetical protein